MTAAKPNPPMQASGVEDRNKCLHCDSGYFSNRYGQDVVCINGVLIDEDEYAEGWETDVSYPVAPCHPCWPKQQAEEDFKNDSQRRLFASVDKMPESCRKRRQEHARHSALRESLTPKSTAKDFPREVQLKVLSSPHTAEPFLQLAPVACDDGVPYVRADIVPEAAALKALNAELESENERLRNKLEWYANPEIYKPHPHGPAFDNRDLSWNARAALTGEASDE